MKISFGTEISVSHERVDFEEPKASYEKREYEKTFISFANWYRNISESRKSGF